MDSLQFKALAKDNDFTRVVISRNRDSHVIVSAILICDNEPQGFTAYNYLRDSEGRIVKFECPGEAENTIRKFGYKGPITLPASGEKVPKPAEVLKKQELPKHMPRQAE